jgi:hypothetical protein
MSQSKDSSSVQVNDLKGTISIDFFGGLNGDLFEFARDLHIDTNKYTPIGISLDIGKNNYLRVEFICIDEHQRESFQQENEGRVPVIIFHRKPDLMGFLSRLRRVMLP